MTIFFIFALFFTSIYLLLYFLLSGVLARTGSAAIIMSLGIVSQGVLKHFISLDGLPGLLISSLVFSSWIFLVFVYSNTFVKGQFRNLHTNDPVNFFAIGTWVAGTSICCITLYNHIGSIYFVIEAIAILNTAMWIGYISLCIKKFYIIIKSKSFDNVHGLLLLTTVSTQSLVLLYNTVFKNFTYLPGISFSLIIIGAFFYFVGMLFIIKRYMKRRWKITDEWMNTNCIIHGAVSITGIACLFSKVFSQELVSVVWMTAFILLIVIEGIEIVRGLLRLKKYGITKGILVYDVSQWARVFTLGMFYAFSLKLSPFYIPIRLGFIWQNFILDYTAYVILLLLFIQLILFIKHIKRLAQSDNILLKED
jgi:hypothetical protein